MLTGKLIPIHPDDLKEKNAAKRRSLEADILRDARSNLKGAAIYGIERSLSMPLDVDRYDRIRAIVSLTENATRSISKLSDFLDS